MRLLKNTLAMEEAQDVQQKNQLDMIAKLGVLQDVVWVQWESGGRIDVPFDGEILLTYFACTC